ncbi:MAG: YdbH domain-containing protein [Parerythrobacter sp.]
MAAHETTETELGETPRRPVWRKRTVRFLFALALLIGLAVVAAWLARDWLASGVIDEKLAALDLPATYDVERIGPGEQVLTDIVIGDPARPDLTMARMRVALGWNWRTILSGPTVGRVTVDKARLFGAVDEDGISFGSLDPLLFGSDDSRAGLPAIDLAVRDGRALVETPYGPVGVKLDGEGDLSGGFTATTAATAPALAIADCRLSQATAFGTLQTRNDGLDFEGPVRLGNVRCSNSAFAMRMAAFQTTLSTDLKFSEVSVATQTKIASVAAAGSTLRAIRGPVEAQWRAGDIDAVLDLATGGATLAGSRLSSGALDARIRLREGYSRWEADGEVQVRGADIAMLLAPGIRTARVSAKGTMLAALLDRFGRASAQQLSDTAIAARFTARRNPQGTSVIVPQATVRNAGGGVVLSASQFRYAQGVRGLPRLSGNVRSAGEGLPTIVGRMERGAGGRTQFRLRMDPYRVGADRLAIPALDVEQRADGSLSFDGRLTVGGRLPGGSVRDLSLPISGRLDADGRLALWERCTTVGFDRFAFANLEMSQRALRLCPVRGRAIVSTGPQGLAIAAGVPALDVSGTLAGTPIRIASGPVGFAYPGTAMARNVEVSLGPVASASRFTLSSLTARIDSSGKMDGTFSDTTVTLAAVPLDLVNTSGDWRYADGVLELADAQGLVEDRQPNDRFYPLAIRDGTLTLRDNVIDADAVLRHPEADDRIADLTITHDLGRGAGGARFIVPALTFTPAFQPDDLTKLLLGVVANVRGTVTGQGRIDWTPETLTSGGAFSSEDLDLAAAFGPVKGASGTVRFTDLLSLTTAPDQRIAIASINPGIEVTNGQIAFSLRDGQFLGVSGGEWPFMGGTLYLRPTQLNLSAEETRRYVLEVQGLDAATFVQTLDVPNISASGTFDGALPLVFDAQGNGRVDGGTLRSRPPGGNLSYVGELSYEDMGTMANYAFSMLRSLDFTTMDVVIDGPLTGDILSQITLDGVKQGEGASRNIFTRQFENLPIQFNININAPFYKLMGTLKSMYDPATVRDPRELGLLTDDGVRLREATTQEEIDRTAETDPDPPPAKTPDHTPQTPKDPIQRRESEQMP